MVSSHASGDSCCSYVVNNIKNYILKHIYKTNTTTNYDYSSHAPWESTMPSIPLESMGKHGKLWESMRRNIVNETDEAK
jgi:hypothetical protein